MTIGLCYRKFGPPVSKVCKGRRYNIIIQYVYTTLYTIQPYRYGQMYNNIVHLYLYIGRFWAQKEGISHPAAVCSILYRWYTITSISSRPYIIYIFYIYLPLSCVLYVRFSTAGQSNLLTTRTRRTSTFTAVMYSVHAARSFKTYIIYFSRKKNCFPFHTNFVSALDRYAFLFYYYLFKWSAALPTTSHFGHKTRELCGFVCRNSISVITSSDNNIPIYLYLPMVEVCLCYETSENQYAASN